jgi:hypothetical protein
MHHAARLCPDLLAFFSAGVFAADLRVDLDRLVDQFEPRSSNGGMTSPRGFSSKIQP